MDGHIRIESKDVPKYGYKAYTYNPVINRLRTFYRKDLHREGKFNKPQNHKKSHVHIMFNKALLHFGRISVFISKDDAIYFCKLHKSNNRSTNIECWKVEIKQTTKYAYRGLFGYLFSLAVDQVKPIKRVWKC